MQRIAFLLLLTPTSGCAVLADYYFENHSEARLEAQARHRDAPIMEPYTVWRPTTEYRKAYPVYMRGEQLNGHPQVAVQYHVPQPVISSVNGVHHDYPPDDPSCQTTAVTVTPRGRPPAGSRAEPIPTPAPAP